MSSKENVIHEDGREWDRQLQFLLWAYREVPDATTHVSPYQFVFGKVRRGSTAFLKESWSAEQSSIP